VISAFNQEDTRAREYPYRSGQIGGNGDGSGDAALREDVITERFADAA